MFHVLPPVFVKAPDNVVFVMDATIGQACETQVRCAVTILPHLEQHAGISGV